MTHNWVKSTLGHGEAMCSKCKITNREAAVLGLLNQCSVDDEWSKWKGEGPAPKKWWATNPEGESVLVYRSYEDYCMD